MVCPNKSKRVNEPFKNKIHNHHILLMIHPKFKAIRLGKYVILLIVDCRKYSVKVK